MKRFTRRQTRKTLVVLSAIFTVIVLLGVSQPYLATYQNYMAKKEIKSLIEPSPAPIALSEPVYDELSSPIAEHPLPRVHVVQPGETLNSISKTYYGNAKYWKTILEANRDSIPNRHKLKAGTQLVIPYQP